MLIVFFLAMGLKTQAKIVVKVDSGQA